MTLICCCYYFAMGQNGNAAFCHSTKTVRPYTVGSLMCVSVRPPSACVQLLCVFVTVSYSPSSLFSVRMSVCYGSCFVCVCLCVLVQMSNTNKGFNAVLGSFL